MQELVDLKSIKAFAANYAQESEFLSNKLDSQAAAVTALVAVVIIIAIFGGLK